MCAIFGSYDKDKFIELAELNSYRGQHSYSVSAYFPSSRSLTLIKKAEGKFVMPEVAFYERAYWIGHIQAPTTESKEGDSIHPSVNDRSHLWHNGIIKEDCIRYMQFILKMDNVKWDTKLLHEWYDNSRPLDSIDGTFSCLLCDNLNGNIKLFRNEISPMFVDGELNISSTKFPCSSRTKANTVLNMDFNDNVLVEEYTFSTKENPYYFANGV